MCAFLQLPTFIFTIYEKLLSGNAKLHFTNGRNVQIVIRLCTLHYKYLQKDTFIMSGSNKTNIQTLFSRAFGHWFYNN